MSELRKDPLLDRWVIVAPERDRPPVAPGRCATEPVTTAAPCPFCPGNEALTPAAITVLRAGAQGPWSARVFPHRDPALRVEGALDPQAHGLLERLQGLGAHEVVVETPEHGRGWADLEPSQLGDVLRLWRDRQRDLYGDGRLEHVMITKLHDPGGRIGGLRGAVSHSHSHIIGLPITPSGVQGRIERALAHHTRTRRCLICDLLQQAVRESERVVAADEHTVVVAPYASRFPFELRIMPRRHQHCLGAASDAELDSLARVVVDCCDRLRLALDDPAFDITLHGAPNPRPLRPHPFDADRLAVAWHWHLELVPRILPCDGSAHATDLHVNPTPPEAAAMYLRGLT